MKDRCANKIITISQQLLYEGFALIELRYRIDQSETDL